MITRRSLDRFAVGCAVAMALVCGGWLRADWARGQEAASREPADAAPAERDELPSPATAAPRYSDPAESPSRQLRVYRLRYADPALLIDALESMAPEAQFTIDGQHKSVLVVGSEQSHEAVAEALSELDVLPEDGHQIKIFRLINIQADSAAEVLAELLHSDEVRIAIDERSNSVIVTSSEHVLNVAEAVLLRLDQQVALTKESQPPVLEVYQLRHATAGSLVQLLRGVTDDAKLRVEADDAGKRLIVFGSPQTHEMVKDLLEKLDAPSEEGEATRIFPLRQADPDSVSLVLSALFSSDEARIATDQRTNALIVTCSQEKMAVVEEILAELDEQAEERERQYARPVTFQVRVVWLAGSLSGEETADPAEDLKDVVAELSKVGVSGLRQVGQAMVSTTPDGSFQVGSSPIFQEQEVDWEISGELRNVTEEGTYHLDMNIQLAAISERHPRPSFDQLVDLEVQIAASCGRYVVLGVTPIGSLTSAFVVQVTAGGP